MGSHQARTRRRSLFGFGLTLGLGALIAVSVAGAATAPVGMGTAGSFGVLAGAGVTNTGPSVIDGDLGTCPTPAITGFPPGVVNGTTHAGDALACGAQSDLTIAYNDAAGRAPTTTFPGATELGGATLTPGVYKTPTSLAVTGTLTLDAQGDPSEVFIFQAGSTLLTASNSTVALINGAQPCNVFWQVGSSATLGVGSTFIGTILALTSITANTSALIQGRLLARSGAVTLDSNRVTTSVCTPVTTTTTVPATTTTLPGTTTTTVPATTTTLPAATTTTVPATTTTLPATTTTTVPVTTTTLPATTTTTVPATTTTLPATTTTTVPATATATAASATATATAFGGGGGGSATTSTMTGTGGPSTSGGLETGTLARTGSSIRWALVLSGVALALGGIMVLLGRGSPQPAGRRERFLGLGGHRDKDPDPR